MGGGWGVSQPIKLAKEAKIIDRVGGHGEENADHPYPCVVGALAAEGVGVGVEDEGCWWM